MNVESTNGDNENILGIMNDDNQNFRSVNFLDSSKKKISILGRAKEIISFASDDFKKVGAGRQIFIYFYLFHDIWDSYI